MAIVYIGLGSNMGNRKEYLRNAVINILKQTGAALMAESSIKETKAVDFEDQPDFLNQIIKIQTEMEPQTLLKILKKIEEDMGRIYRFSKGPREIDLDILLYDDIIISESMLKIPHPQILKRDFILEHLIELDSDLIEPVSKRKYSEVYNHGSF
ncbi:MAG TPA: 2-amino-4-hydroxy-6-hydroxymethyldihydropteridine diphosphokinase [Spirochaetota bacterium]|nr:2-amino-4-hydroxy-6-hydroxymethyldihydropteridine diphosphokinase [Spirochaetota bacterium]HPS86110.1 2-amino-4-hydroxy-6-hydroxymethyldihydropteridine diphosphokinase [Spirochaetota bacterium]